MRRALLLAGSAAALLTLGIAGSAGAQTDTTTVTVSLVGAGGLAIDAPGTASGSGSTTPGSTVSISLADTTVTDNRGSLLGWTVTAASTDLTTGTAVLTEGEVIPAAAMTWATGSVSAIAPADANGVVAGVGGTLAAAVPVAVGTPLLSAGSYTYPATVTVVVPPNVLEADYTATITQTAI